MGVDAFPLFVHHVVVFEEVLTDREILRFHLLLSSFDGSSDQFMLDGYSLFHPDPGHQPRDPVAADNPLVVELWPGKVPDETGSIGAEKSLMSPRLDRKQVEVTEPTRMVTNVSKPTITIYRPAKDGETGTAMLICPGGGYWNLYWQLEGEEVARWLNSLGVTGIILKYRVPRRPDEPKGEPARRPLQDAQRAVSLVRSKAAGWGISPKRIGSSVSRQAVISRWPRPPVLRNGPMHR